MCSTIKLDGMTIDFQWELRRALGREPVMREGLQPNSDACLCAVDIPRTTELCGYGCHAPRRTGHGVEVEIYRLPVGHA